MDCPKIKEKLYLFIDGELDSNESLLIKEHILSCPLCALMLDNEKKIDLLIREGIPKMEAPFALKETILNKLEESTKLRFLPRIVLQPKPVLVSILVVLLLIISSVPIIMKKQDIFPVFGESIKDHIKFLQGNLSIDIASNNSKEVHSWLQTKLDFKVMVPDLSSQGVGLLGARLCAFKDKNVAYMVYEKNGHKLSVFMFDAEGVRFPKAKKVAVNNKIFYLSKEKGYNSALWIDEGIACVFVSDLDEAELLHLASL